MSNNLEKLLIQTTKNEVYLGYLLDDLFYVPCNQCSNTREEIVLKPEEICYYYNVQDVFKTLKDTQTK